MSDKTIVVVLGGGRGTRLFPLTALRAKPAVPLGGKYRLIDIPISNALNSGMRKIFVLTQFNSASLNTHLTKTYRFDAFSNGFVEVLAAEQTDSSGDWYQGTADAVRQHLHRVMRRGVEHVLILSGDHLYRMDYRELIERHEEAGADITVSTIPLEREQCSGFGVMAVDERGLLTEFREKPAEEEDLSPLAVPESLRERWGLNAPFLASMGVYVFRADLLAEVLAEPQNTDFGKHILPQAIASDARVAAHVFDGYWEDIGTIQAFYEANMMLTKEDSPFKFYVPEAPIYTRPRFLPPSVVQGELRETLMGDGSLVLGATVRGSVIGLRSVLWKGCTVEASIIMGADYYETAPLREAAIARGLPPIGIGEGSSVKHAIIDKNARIGKNVVIHGRADRPDEDHEHWAVKDGIVVVHKNAIIPDGTTL